MAAATLPAQLERNAELWRILTGHGVTEATQLRLDFFYYTRNGAEAEALRHFLESETDYDVQVSSKGSLFRKRWCVSGTTQPTCVSREILDDWVRWMSAAGEDHGCEFDGWGTSIPGKPPS